MGTAFVAIEVLRRCVDGLVKLSVVALGSTGPAVPAAALGAVPDRARVVS
ncbi:hypothetical protein M8C13_00565 [Crossiella sp. SN42]|nr:hypothetical protein [Crossiella sp. SN42]MCO1574249.1 hypothetical protein [Crossiella sp. SN42]